MAEVFNTVPVRTDSGVVLDTQLTAALPAGGNTIGAVTVSGTADVNITNASLDVEITTALPTGGNTIGNVGITGTPAVTVSGTTDVEIVAALPTGANTIGNVGITGSLPTGANTIGAVTISGTPSVNATIVAALPAGTNIIGKVEVVSSAGTIVQEVVATVTDIPKNGETATLNSTAIPNGKKGELRQIIVGASVAMKAVIRIDNTVTPVNKAVAYIPAGGGTVDLEFMNEAIVLNGTAAGENFDVVFTNLDRTNDAPATITFVYSLEP